jgi:YbgC/YbaW family acyl-CoA thioester hydrolase
MKKFETTLRVRSYELDFFGHVNNAVYVQYLEVARANLLYEMGFSFEYFAAENLMPVVANININYKFSAKLNDDLLITGWLSKVGTSSFALKHEAFNLSQGNALTFDAEVISVFIDSRTGKSIPIPDAFRNHFNDII